MAYNKFLNNSYISGSSFKIGDHLVSKGSSFINFDRLNISQYIDDDSIQNKIESIVFENNDILVSGSLSLTHLAQLSSVNLLKTLNNSSQVKKINKNIGLGLSQSETYQDVLDFKIFNEETNSNIFVSSSIFSNYSSIFKKEVSGSGIFSDPTSPYTTKNIIESKGGVQLNLKQDENTNYYYELSLGSNNQSPSFNVTYLSNDKQNIKGYSSTGYDNDTDVLIISGNYYPQFDWLSEELTNNGLADIEDAWLSKTGNIIRGSVNNNFKILNIKSKYDLIPQCVILRPCNYPSSNTTNIDQINHYFTGETHYIKLSIDKNFFNETDLTCITNTFMLDLTSPVFISNLKRGFKFDILLDDFNNKVIETKTEVSRNNYPNFNSSTFIFNFMYPLYLPWAYMANNSNSLSKIKSFGWQNSFGVSVSGFYRPGYFYRQPTTLTPSWSTGGSSYTFPEIKNPIKVFQKNLSNVSLANMIGAPASNKKKLVKNGINILYMASQPPGYNPDNYRTWIETPENPSDGDFFYTWFFNAVSPPSNYSIPDVDVFYPGDNTTPRFRLSTRGYWTISNNTNTLSNEYGNPNSVNPVVDIIKFQYSSSRSSWSPVAKGFSSDFEHDFGGLQYPTHFMVDLPPGHTIVNEPILQNSWNGHNIYNFKNNCDFYLYGDKDDNSSGISQNLTSPPAVNYINGGWLRAKSLPGNQNEKSGFKKVYKNLHLLVANIVNRNAYSFNWQKYSNFQLIYLGNNEWLIN